MNVNNEIKKILLNCPTGAKISYEGEEYSYFGGTSYYELHKNVEVLNAAHEAINRFGITNSSSRNIFGTTQLHLELEKAAAEYFNCDSAVYLPSGFLTDIAATQAFLNKKLFDVIYIDQFAHYSNQYAAKISGKPIIEYEHLNWLDLDTKISSSLHANQIPLIISDGIFPVFGKIAPVDKYTAVIEKYNGLLWLDDAHALGVLGSNGRGTFEHFSIDSDRCFFGGTFSKAFGGFGGIIPGKIDFINEIKNDLLQNGSTPPPCAAAAASLTGLKLLKTNPSFRNNLWNNTRRLKTGIRELGIQVEKSDVPIVAWQFKNVDEMQKIQSELFKKKIIIQFINYIGTGNSSALRIVVFSSHTIEQIDYLISELKKIL